MPKLKRKSYFQRKDIKRTLARKCFHLKDKGDECRAVEQRTARLEQLRENQQRRLRLRSSHAIQKEREQICQKRRLMSPTHHAIHLRRERDCQKKRLQNPTKRDIHLQRETKCQNKRLKSQTNHAVHLKRLRVCQKKRLQNHTQRAIHCERDKLSHRKRLLCPTKRAIHLERAKLYQMKRLQCTIKRAQHNKVMRGYQQDSLRDSINRRLLVKNLIKAHKRRLHIAFMKQNHLKRCHKAQETSLKDSAALIVNTGRALLGIETNVSKNTLRHKTNIYSNFLSEKKRGPTHSCDSCHRLWFQSSIKICNTTTLKSAILNAACGPIDSNKVSLCNSCYKSLKIGKMPTLSLGNKALCFPDIPEEIKKMTELEERFICPRIPFMSIRAAISDQQYLVKGRAVNVPVEIPTSVSILPRTMSETKVVPICFRRKKKYKTNVAFEYVRPHMIKKAALLLQNSPLYKHFNITLDVNRVGDNVTFQSMELDRPNHNANHDNNCDQDDDNDEEEDDDTEPINIDDDETMLTNAIVFAPGEGHKPESLFSEYVEAQCFIKIYGGQLIQQPQDVSYQNWIKSEIMRDDRRCAYVTKLFFSALKLRTSKMASSISFCLRKSKSKKNDVTARHLLDEDTIKNFEIHDSGFRVFAADRGTPAYWELKKKELFAMLRQLGPPTIFLTLSPSETRWEELIVILKRVLDNVIINEEMASLIEYEERVRLVKNDPVTVARYFEYRMRRLFNVLKQESSVFGDHNVIDYYIRTEFQQRGSPHLHCLLWLKDPPIYREDSQNENVIEFIDRFITCSALVPPEMLQLQTHKHTFTCRKGLKKNDRKCRFDIPFFPVSETVILSPLTEEEVDKEQQKKMREIRNKIQEKLAQMQKNKEVKTMEVFVVESGLTYEDYLTVIRSGLRHVTIFLKRSPQECMINFYNPELLLLHQGNMDMKFITDMYSCATYILNYVNKSNNGISKLLREASAEIKQGNFTMKEQLRKLANEFLNGSEFSAQEAVYYILALPLSSCSRHCQFINTNTPEKRVAVIKRKCELEKLTPDSTDIFTKDILYHYAQRPIALENVSLADFVACYNFSKKKIKSSNENFECDNDEQTYSNDRCCLQLLDKSGYLNKRRRPKVIRFVNYNEHHDEYVRENVMLFWPWRNEEAMMRTAPDDYRRHILQIKENRSKYIFNETILTALEDAEQLLRNTCSDNDDVETPHDLRIYDAPSSQIIYGPNADIDGAIPANNKICNNPIILPIPKMIPFDEYTNIVITLNSKQRQFVLHVLHLFKEDKLPFYHCVLGGAGVGKSRLINALEQTTLRHLNMSGGQLDSLKVLLCAPTGKAAFVIKGTTIHAAFVLPLNQCSADLVPLSNSTRNTLRSKLRDVKLIIIDEISMVGTRMFQQIDCRLKQIFSSSLPFAGISLIVLGDFNQLAPVGDRFIFQSHTSHAYGNIIGNPLWEMFKCFKMNEIMRQKGDAEFAFALNQLAEGSLNEYQIKMFQSRFVHDYQIPEEAIHLFRTNEQVDTYNNQLIDKDPNKKIVESIDKVTGNPNQKIEERLLKAAKCSLAKECQGLPFNLKLSLNIKYIITVNVNVEDGLVNGAVGILKEIEYGSNLSIKRLWLLFPDEVGKQKRRETAHKAEPQWTAVERVIRAIRPSRSPHSVLRKQFPLVPAEAMTIYKSQGSTYEHVAVHLVKGMRRTELYVAFSRCTSLSGLNLIGHFTAPPAPSATDKVVLEMEKLSKKPVIMSCFFPSMFANEVTVVYHNTQSLKHRAHWADFQNFMKHNQPTIFIAAETWTLPDEPVSCEGYDVLLRLDCKLQRHAFGLLVFIKKDFKGDVIFQYSNDTKGESCCLATVVCNDFALCTGYKPPSTSITSVQELFDTAIKLAMNQRSKVIILGDFNIDVNCKPTHYFYNNLNREGFDNQLPKDISTTNSHTGIDCIFSNFKHQCGVTETFFSHHKALICIPHKIPEQFPLPASMLTKHVHQDSVSSLPVSSRPIKKGSLQNAIHEGRLLFNSMKSKARLNEKDVTTIKSFISFMRQGELNRGFGKKADYIVLPPSLDSCFIPIRTTGDGNCFYYAISYLLCGRETLALGLRAVVAHHMQLNHDFIENLPLSIGLSTEKNQVLINYNYAELLEVVFMTYILKRPINIYSTIRHGSMRFAPCQATNELHLLLDLNSKHYSALHLKRNKTPEIPDEVQNLPQIDEFITYN